MILKPSPIDDRNNRPATPAEALELLRRSALPVVKVRTLADLIDGRRGCLIRRVKLEGRQR